MDKQENSMQPPALGDFDIRAVHVIDPLTKRLARINPYKMIVTDGVRYMEHPVGSGNLYWESTEPLMVIDNKACGRFEAGKIYRDRPHVAYVKPLTSDEKLGREMANTKQENARLTKELAEIKAENALKAKPVKDQVVVPKVVATAKPKGK